MDNMDDMPLAFLRVPLSSHTLASREATAMPSDYPSELVRWPTGWEAQGGQEEKGSVYRASQRRGGRGAASCPIAAARHGGVQKCRARCAELLSTHRASLHRRSGEWPLRVQLSPPRQLPLDSCHDERSLARGHSTPYVHAFADMGRGGGGAQLSALQRFPLRLDLALACREDTVFAGLTPSFALHTEPFSQKLLQPPFAPSSLLCKISCEQEHYMYSYVRYDPGWFPMWLSLSALNPKNRRTNFSIFFRTVSEIPPFRLLSECDVDQFAPLTAESV